VSESWLDPLSQTTVYGIRCDALAEPPNLATRCELEAGHVGPHRWLGVSDDDLPCIRVWSDA